jgi:hypothetical protein
MKEKIKCKKEWRVATKQPSRQESLALYLTLKF